MTAPTLINLPQELHIYLLDFLDWQSITKLRLTTSYFANILPPDTLIKHHAKLTAVLYHEELAKERQIQKDFWEAAEQSFLGYHSSCYTSSSLDPDLRAHGDRYSCTSTHLPCYRCLQWLPSVTDEPHFAAKSAFSRGRSVCRFNLAGKDAIRRICITCGIRSGMYPKGSKVKHSVVCKRCGVLGDSKDTWTWRWSDPRRTWQVSLYCQSCCDHEDIVRQTLGMFMHEQRWSRYEEGMTKGKLYRLEKGKKLREERGLICRTTEEFGGTVNAKPRYCVTMKEMRLCNCHPERGFDPLDDPTIPHLRPSR